MGAFAARAARFDLERRVFARLHWLQVGWFVRRGRESVAAASVVGAIGAIYSYPFLLVFILM